MAFRALALDLDGTLLVGESVPADNVRAVRAAVDAGYRVVIATARWREVATEVCAEIGISGPIVACSGAQVHMPDTGTDIHDVRLPEDFTDALYAICDAERCVATVTIGDAVLLKLDGQPDPASLPRGLTWVPALASRRESLPRVAAIQGSKANQRIRDELQARFEHSVNFYDSIGPNGKTILTLTHKRADKGVALRVALDQLGIAPAEVVAFGDAENDIQMFRIAGASVAMGQADDAIKRHATFVTLPNTECGVAHAIDRLLANGTLD
jgi:hypothetical protein